MDDDARAVVLVEGASDQVAVETLARRLGRDLAAEGVAVVPMGGATNIRVFLARYGPAGRDLKLAGLCDVGEQGAFRSGLERAGFGDELTRADMEALGFYVCVVDLEDELIRAVGPANVLQIVEAEGELGSFRTLQKQTPHLDRPLDAQLHRFMGSKGGRKLRYAHLLVDALDLPQVPAPLTAVLTHV